MRWFHLVIASILLIIIVVIASYLSRSSLFLHFANQRLSAFEITANCAQLSFDRHLNITFDKLCLAHPLAKTQLEQLKVDWHVTATGFGRFSTTIDSVQLEKLVIIEKDRLTDTTEAVRQKLSLQQLHHVLGQLAAFKLPASIAIERFEYHVSGQPLPYPGTFAADENGLSITLKTPQLTPLLWATLNTEENKLFGEFKSDLFETSKLMTVLGVHLPIPLDIRGHLHTSYHWQDNLLSLDNTLQTFDIASEQGFEFTGPFALNGSIQFNSKLNLTTLTTQFKQQAPVSIDIDETAIQAAIGKHKYVLTYLQDNATNGFFIQPLGTWTVNLDNQSLAIEQLQLLNKNPEAPVKIVLSQLTSDFALKQLSSTFKADIKANLNRLLPFTAAPGNITTAGHLTMTGNTIKLDWPDPSKVVLSQLSKDNTAKLEQIELQWQGTAILTPMQPVKMSLQLTSQSSKLQVKDWLKADDIALTATIDGTPNNMSLNGSLTADKMPLANVNLSGDMTQPQLQISGEAIPLADLSTLMLYRPIAFDLLDGHLDYQLKGQIHEFSDLLQNSITLTVEAKNISGTVKKMWLQDLNYQQTIEIEAGNITALPTQHNLALALFESPLTLTQIKASLGFERIQQRFSLTLENVSGNVFEGQFSVPQFAWPTTPEQAVLLQLNNIDLEKIMALQKQQGIVVTGKIAGQLPLYFSHSDTGNMVTISDGQLYNVTDGIIKVKDNPGVVRLKQSQSTLKLAFDALENLEYNNLTSAVTMSDDGQMLLENKIKGYNPDLDNEVNFNLNLDYDLLGLLKSLTIADTIEQQVNKNATKEKQ